MVINIRKSKKLKDIYISFTKDEWTDYKSRYGKAFVEELLKSYDLYLKNTDPRKNLCGIWCNEEDSFRYYITDHNGYYSFMVENRDVKIVRNIIKSKQFSRIATGFQFIISVGLDFIFVWITQLIQTFG